MNNEKIKNFWETCGTTFAHITTDNWLKNKNNLFNLYFRNIEYFNIDPSNKTIIDYGIGGGYLGMYLMDNYQISKYIGIDIAERSLNSAKANLDKHLNTEFHIAPVEFSKLKSDLFISFAVIQHFPDKEYLDSFLYNINKSNISELLLQIRYSDINIFAKSYETHADVRLGCQTNSKYMLKILNNYILKKSSDIQEETKYQYLYFKIK